MSEIFIEESQIFNKKEENKQMRSIPNIFENLINQNVLKDKWRNQYSAQTTELQVICSKASKP